MKENNMNNLYIINEVLWDYTAGMAVIAAPSLERCRELYIEEFGWYKGPEDSDFCKEHDAQLLKEFDQAPMEVFEGIATKEGVVSYVYGGS